eukprot:3069258-Pyramimonas_sp.AAC.1
MVDYVHRIGRLARRVAREEEEEEDLRSPFGSRPSSVRRARDLTAFGGTSLRDDAECAPRRTA